MCNGGSLSASCKRRTRAFERFVPRWTRQKSEDPTADDTEDGVDPPRRCMAPGLQELLHFVKRKKARSRDRKQEKQRFPRTTNRKGDGSRKNPGSWNLLTVEKTIYSPRKDRLAGPLVSEPATRVACGVFYFLCVQRNLWTFHAKIC